MNHAESLDMMLRYDRSIISPDTANELLAPWGQTLASIGADAYVTRREEGANWAAREEVWDAGDSIGAYTVVTLLADHLEAPDVEYETNYGGTGKRAAAMMQKAVKRLRAFRDENGEVDADEWACPVCGGSGVRCCEFGADR